MQELCVAVVQFFELVIEKYITHFPNPNREWTYFKSLLNTTKPDINRIQSYLKVLHTTLDTPQQKTIEIPKVEVQIDYSSNYSSYLPYISPLREHNIPLEKQQSLPVEIQRPLFTQESARQIENIQSQQSIQQQQSKNQNQKTICSLSSRLKLITNRIVNTMQDNDISLAYTKEYQRTTERRFSDANTYQYRQ